MAATTAIGTEPALRGAKVGGIAFPNAGLFHLLAGITGSETAEPRLCRAE
jgi:hypothetical protein